MQLDDVLTYLSWMAKTTPRLFMLRKQAQLLRRSIVKLSEPDDIKGISGNFPGQDFVVLFIGESTIAGVGATSHEKGFAGAFSNYLSENLKRNVRWSVYARSGYTMKKINLKLLPKITETSCNLIVIGIGANDAFTMISPWNWEKHLNHFLKVMEKRFGQSPVLFANMPPVHEFPAFTPLLKSTGSIHIKLLSKQLNDITNKSKHHFFNTEIISISEIQDQTMVSETQAGYADGIHPNEQAYQIWAKLMVDFLLKSVIFGKKNDEDNENTTFLKSSSHKH